MCVSQHLHLPTRPFYSHLYPLTIISKYKSGIQRAKFGENSRAIQKPGASPLATESRFRDLLKSFHRPSWTARQTIAILVINTVMVSDTFQSPNAIPPRTSSSGLSNGSAAAAKPVLKPVPEGNWIAPSRRLHTTSSSSGLPATDPPRSNGNDIQHSSGNIWSTEKEKILLGPYDYMFDHPGKDVRKQLIAAFNAWLKVPEESLAIITSVVGMLHTASLLYVPHQLRPDHY